jgi:hypothetical protein
VPRRPKHDTKQNAAVQAGLAIAGWPRAERLFPHTARGRPPATPRRISSMRIVGTDPIPGGALGAQLSALSAPAGPVQGPSNRACAAALLEGRGLHQPGLEP